MSHIDTSQFNAMLREFSVRAKVPSDEVLISEVGKVLAQAIKYTPAARVSKIRGHFEKAIFSAQPRSLYTPKRAGAAATGSNVLYYLGNRYPAALWNAMSARRKRSLLARLKARGLSKQSWLELGKQLGVTISAAGFVRAAVPSSGKRYRNTSVKVARQQGKLQIAIENAQPTVNLPQVGGARALQRAIDGRVKYFIRNVGLGTFDDVAKVAKRYKGMRVTAAS